MQSLGTDFQDTVPMDPHDWCIALDRAKVEAAKQTALPDDSRPSCCPQQSTTLDFGASEPKAPTCEDKTSKPEASKVETSTGKSMDDGTLKPEIGEHATKPEESSKATTSLPSSVTRPEGLLKSIQPISSADQRKKHPTKGRGRGRGRGRGKGSDKEASSKDKKESRKNKRKPSKAKLDTVEPSAKNAKGRKNKNNAEADMEEAKEGTPEAEASKKPRGKRVEQSGKSTPKSKAKREKTKKGEPKDKATSAKAAEGDDDPAIAKKKAQSRKSSAYHCAKGKALKEGKSKDEAVRLAKEVAWSFLVYCVFSKLLDCSCQTGSGGCLFFISSLGQLLRHMQRQSEIASPSFLAVRTWP